MNESWGVSGHRPPRLGDYDAFTYRRLVDLARACWKRFRPRVVNSGLALGWDQACAEAARDLDIPYNALIPHEGQESTWPRGAQKRYHTLIEHAAKVILVCPGMYGSEKMSQRNQLVVDLSDHLLVLWDGQDRSGTHDTVQRAIRAQKPYVNVWASWQAFKNQHA
jgi:uncharacterized phage-like protein YoqJ